MNIFTKVIDRIINEHKSRFSNEQHKRAGAEDPRRYRHDYYKKRWEKQWHLRGVGRDK